MPWTAWQELVVFATLALAASAACADDAPAPPPACSVWLMDTRGLGGFDSAWQAPPIAVHRFDERDGWAASSLSQFFAADDPRVVTVFYVHGNRFKPHEAVERGWLAKEALDGCPHGPLRFVIWSWPSDPLHGPLKDVRAKAQRAEIESVLLGWTLERLHPQTPVGAIGFSYGARVISGALHIRAGGSLSVGRLPPAAAPAARLPVRAALMAAALDNGWLLPGYYHGLALTQVDSLLLLNNSCDLVLKRFWLIDPKHHPDALGYTGLAGWDWLDEQMQRRIESWDVRSYVGAAHDERRYLTTPDLAAALRRVALWDAPAESSPLHVSAGW